MYLRLLRKRQHSLRILDVGSDLACRDVGIGYSGLCHCDTGRALCRVPDIHMYGYFPRPSLPTSETDPEAA